MKVYNIDGEEIFQSRIKKFKNVINFAQVIAKENEDKRSFDDEYEAQLYLLNFCPNLEIVPEKDEIQDYMERHNADEAGIGNQWTFEDAEYYLLLSDKYHS